LADGRTRLAWPGAIVSGYAEPFDGDPSGWLRAWQGFAGRQLDAPDPAARSREGVREPLPDGSVRYAFNLLNYEPTGID
jgi:hypothetical protein